MEADLLDKDSFMRALEGSTFVAHVASPFTIENPNDEMELIRPAVEGTRAVLAACQAAGVKRVTLTSSMASITNIPEDRRPEVFNESHWSDTTTDEIEAYPKSKTLAERAAWDFIEAMPEGEKIELTVVNPGFVIGPTLVNTDFASGKVINMFMLDKLPAGVPVIKMPVVDVRDIAALHIKCLQTDEAQGKRFIAINEVIWMREIAAHLNNSFGGQGYSIPTAEAKYCFVKFISFFRAEARGIARMWGKEIECDNSRSKEVLGFEYRQTSDSLREMGETMISKGLTEDKRPKST